LNRQGTNVRLRGRKRALGEIRIIPKYLVSSLFYPWRSWRLGGSILRFFLTTILSLATGHASDESGFRPLFDGHSLAGWTSIGGKAGNWRVEGGLLVTRGDGKGWLSTNRAFGDFILKLEYRTGPSGNSGVLLRAPHQGDPSFDGMEVQILDDDSPAYRGLQSAQYSGSVYGVLASKRGHARPPGEWNAMVIRAEGPRIKVELNGTVVVDGDVSKLPEVPPRHRGIGRRSGFLGLQSHSEPVQFRNIAIREIR
jgi:hypothetical protein